MTLVSASLLTLALAAGSVPSVFVIGGFGSDAILFDGASRDNPPPVAAPKVAKGTPYRVVDLTGVRATIATSGEGGVTEEGCGGMERPFIPFDPYPAGDYVLVPGSWTAAPASIRTDRVTKPDAQAIVAGVLKKHGLSKAKVKHGQVIQADVDGDGLEDTVIAASSVDDGAETQAKTDFAVLLVARRVGNTQEIVELSVDVNTNEEGVLPHHIVAIADIDGDGRMEVVAYQSWGEGHGATAYSAVEAGKIVDQNECSV